MGIPGFYPWLNGLEEQLIKEGKVKPGEIQTECTTLKQAIIKLVKILPLLKCVYRKR